VTAAPVALSPLDEARWGVPTAKAGGVTAAGLPAALEFCRARKVAFLIARCAAGDLPAAQALEAAGGRLMDTLVHWARDLGGVPAADAGAPALRPARADEAPAVEALARVAFAGYGGHYHADPRLDRARCDAVYTDWARRSVLDRAVADAVLVAEGEGRLLAFATLRRGPAGEGEGVLFGVAPEAQGRGLYRALMLGGMAWCAAQGRSRMHVSTQVTNLAVQRVWARLGFEPARAEYTFHLWLDP
jgi:GNAT superfamily N-acetyltransferase